MSAEGSEPEPLLIAVAPNGARRGKRDHLALPLTPDELAADALACAEAGAALYHLHVRDEAGRHSLEVDRYRAAVAAIRRAVGDRLVVQITTEACGVYGREAQMALVRDLRPEAASFALRELLPEGEDDARALIFLSEMADAGLTAQFILYTPAEAARLRTLLLGAAPPFLAPSVLFVLGRYEDGPPSEPAALLPFLQAWRDAGPWSVCAFGPRETAAAAAAMALGGHVRVGFENNLQRPDGAPLHDNAEQVARMAMLANAVGRPLANAAFARALGAFPLVPEAVPCV